MCLWGVSYLSWVSKAVFNAMHPVSSLSPQVDSLTNNRRVWKQKFYSVCTLKSIPLKTPQFNLDPEVEFKQVPNNLEVIQILLLGL